MAPRRTPAHLRPPGRGARVLSWAAPHATAGFRASTAAGTGQTPRLTTTTSTCPATPAGTARGCCRQRWTCAAGARAAAAAAACPRCWTRAILERAWPTPPPTATPSPWPRRRGWRRPSCPGALRRPPGAGRSSAGWLAAAVRAAVWDLLPAWAVARGCQPVPAASGPDSSAGQQALPSIGRPRLAPTAPPAPAHLPAPRLPAPPAAACSFTMRPSITWRARRQCA